MLSSGTRNMAAEMEKTGFISGFLFWPWKKATAVHNDLLLVVSQWKSRTESFWLFIKMTPGRVVHQCKTKATAVVSFWVAVVMSPVLAILQWKNKFLMKLTPLNEVKQELQNQKHQLIEELKRVETERKKNKKHLQSVEEEISDREGSDGERLLMNKEDLLKSHWKLDEQKKTCERRILNIEKILEPIEIYEQK